MKRFKTILKYVGGVILLAVVICANIPVYEVSATVDNRSDITNRVIEKVAPYLQPQDSHTRTLLAEQGIDAEYVELVQDYGKTLTTEEKAAKNADPLVKSIPDPNPYALTFKDRKSGQYIYEAQGLPMVNADGEKCVTQWYYLAKGSYSSGDNQFRATINGTSVSVSPLNDQPDARLAKDSNITYSPQLFLGKEEVKPLSVTLLTTDPVNENYSFNTLVWDYGICKRYLRLIEGSILGRWEFADNPKGDVRIVYNCNTEGGLKLGIFAIDKDTEFIPAKVFNSAQYPFTVGDSQTFYPDAHAETSSVDGMVGRAGVSESWANIISGDGNSISDNSPVMDSYAYASTTENQFAQNKRIIVLFDCSGLQDDSTITGAVLSVRGGGKTDNLSASPTINVYSSSPASNTALANGDYNAVGSTAFCDTPITYAGFLISTTFNDFTLNTSGLAAIPVDGVAKFSLRHNYDVSGSQPPWVSAQYFTFRSWASDMGAGYKPKLVVTYAIPSAPTITISAATLITGTTARLNGNVTGTGGENPTVTMYWGDNDGGQVAGDWDNNSAPTSPAQPQGVAAFYKNITGLTSSKTYYFSAKGTNSYGTGWAAASLTFKTRSLIAKIFGIDVTDIHIIW